MRKLVVLILVVAFGLAVFWRIRVIRGEEAVKPEGVESIQKREGIPVRITDVSTGRFEVWRELQGKVEGSLQADVITHDTAKISSIKFKVGDFVPAGKTVVRLDKNDPKDVARVKLLKLVYDEAVGDYKAYKRVHAAGGVAKDVVEKMKLNMESAKSNYEMAKSYVDVVSPIGGVIVSMTARVGERPAPKTPLAVNASIDEVRVMATISDRDAEEIEAGQKVLVTLASGDTVAGAVERISLGANNKSGLFDLEMLVANPDHKLKIGVYTTAEVRVVELDDGAWVPTSSLIPDPDGSYFVWQIDNGKANKTVVTITAQNEESSAVDGLDRDLPVVTAGAQQLKDGAKVLVIKPDKEEADPGAAPEVSPGDTSTPAPGDTAGGR